ncbi:group II truncated hemoglobin [uncultured Roseibium sp.]|uniref:group II truncated hemoglobin n=1 Tax=uncultured Roseibium sp. TaxID=1936171 RepID=UPI003217B94C
MENATQKDTLFDRIGGSEVIDRLVDLFYERMDSLDEAKGIRALHPVDLGPTGNDLKRYLTEWTGGPRLYTPEKGHPRMRQRHMRVAIGEQERDAWLLCMRGALEETVSDAQARAVLYDNMAKLADWMRNQPETP